MRAFCTAYDHMLYTRPVSDRAIGYIRVSTDEQAASGAGLAAQRAAILAEAERRGWQLVDVIEDAGYSGKSMKRPGIAAALDALRQKRADTLVVAKLDRLSRSMLDFAALMDRASHEHWALVALDLGVDTTTPSGEAMANVMATFAQFERRLIAQRTRDALAQTALGGRASGPAPHHANRPTPANRRGARRGPDARSDRRWLDRGWHRDRAGRSAVVSIDDPSGARDRGARRDRRLRPPESRSKEPVSDINSVVGDPLPKGVELVYRWGFLADNLPESIGGGFSSGEFLLRSDGLLLRRSVRDSYSHRATTWHAGPWSVFQRFAPGTDQVQVWWWLRGRHYELRGPTPVAVDQDKAGPYPGLPEEARIHAQVEASPSRE